MPINNIFSTGFNSGFGTGFGVGTGGWNGGQSQGTAQTKAPTKQQKFPGLNAQQIANIEKYTANLTGAEKNQEQQKLYQAMIQAIEAENFNSNRMAVNNERYMNSLSKTDPRECKFDQSACRQSTLVDLVKSARNLRANTDENTVMKMFMQEMDYKGISMDKLNAYLDNGDETILYEAGLKTNQGGTKDVINQLSKNDKSWGEKNTVEKIEDVTNKTNVIGLGTEKIDEAAGKFADKWLDWGNQAVEGAADNLKSKLENMSKEEVAKYRKQYEQLLKDKDWKVAKVKGDTLVEQLWNGLVKGEKYYDYDDEDFMKWLVSKKANFGETLAGADTLLKGETDPNVLQMFGNIPSSALKTFTATVRGMTNPYDTLKGIYKLAATEEGHEAIKARYGSRDNFAKAMNEDPVGVADDALAVLEIGGNIVGSSLKAAGKLSGSTNLTNAGNRVKANNFGSANDVLAQKTVGGVYGVMDNASKLSDSNLVKGVNRVLQDQSSLSKIVTDGKEVYDWAKETTPVKRANNFFDEVINKTVGVDKADRQFIMDNKEIVDDYVSGKKNVDTVLEEVKNKIDEKQLANSEMGKEYDALREKGQTVDTQGLGSDMVDKLKKNKITINADGDLEFDKLSKYNASQQKALQDAWEVVKAAQAAESVDAGSILDLRQKLDDKLNWTGKPTELRNMSSVDKSTEGLIKDMREIIDVRAKAQIDGLKDLDERYAPALEEMREIKKDWFDSDGKLKDSARSKLRNLTKAGNEEKLSRLEKLAPGITQDLKALDVAQTIDRVTKQTVGQYTKGNLIAQGIGGASLLSGNIPGAIVGLGFGILATPKNFIKLLQTYPDIVEKLSAGVELLPSDMERLQALATRLQS